jgi:cobalamin-dependent methionine synthase I
VQAVVDTPPCLDSANSKALAAAIEAVDKAPMINSINHAAYPEVQFTAGLSNISFGLPARSFVNRAFLTLALGAGLDSAILDPLDRELRTALLAAELVLGRDDYCLNYTRAYRAGLFNGSGAKAGCA